MTDFSAGCVVSKLIILFLIELGAFSKFFKLRVKESLLKLRIEIQRVVIHKKILTRAEMDMTRFVRKKKFRGWTTLIVIVVQCVKELV